MFYGGCGPGKRPQPGSAPDNRDRRHQMKLTVFGATGRIGEQVVRQALDAGHKVTAVVRDPARFDVRHPALEVATVAGLTDPEVLRPALEGSDAAISGVGPRGRKDRKSTRLNSSHVRISYAVFCLKKKKNALIRIWFTKKKQTNKL